MNLLESLERQLDGVAGDPLLRAVRGRAFAHARQRGLPTLRDEDWKYTDLSPALRAHYVAPDTVDGAGDAASILASLPFAGVSAHRLVFVNGHYRADLSSLGGAVDGLPDGVTVRPLHAVLRTEPALVEAHLARFAGDEAGVFTALNAAFVQDGAYIEALPGATAGAPILIVFLSVPHAAPLLCAPHVVIKAGARSRLEVVEAYLGTAGAANMTNALTDIQCGAGARVAHYRLEDEAPDATHIGNVFATLAADGEVVSYSFAFGGALARIDVNAALAERGASVTLNGLFRAGEGQHIDHHTRIDHRAGRTQSRETYKGIASGNGRGVFNGKIIVRPDAQKISAIQASNNLLLSGAAEIDTKPELEIYADDVSCAHGATVGQLDDDALFYLRARGIAEADARALLTYGFAHEVIEQVPYPALRGWLATRLTGRGQTLRTITGLD